MTDKLNNNHFDIVAFNDILRLVLFNNYFTFENKFYRQCKGLSMGSQSSPAIAILFVYILEKNFPTLHKPIFYQRFIDDIFIIVSEEFNIDILINFFGYLKSNLSSSKVLQAPKNGVN